MSKFPILIPIPEEVEEQAYSEYHDELQELAMEDGYIPWEDAEGQLFDD